MKMVYMNLKIFLTVPIQLLLRMLGLNPKEKK